MNGAITQLFFSLGIGGIGGFLIGYATKKVVKIAMFVLGLFLISLFYLMSKNVITINIENLYVMIGKFFEQTIVFVSNIIPILPITGSFACGFMLGILKG
ncbi:hypothetical protein KJN74_03165 [Candidatus Bathyarchaeota archaeon]|nr:hypothetical protein [Candidatus Bathyarchaeota archaeon]